MTTGQARNEVVKTAWACSAAVFVTLLLVTWAGPAILSFFGITVDSLRAAGGLIVLIIGLHMLFNKAEHKQSEAEVEDGMRRESIAVVPLAIPIVAGPGTMATVLVATQQSAAVLSKLEISVVIAAAAMLIGVVFTFSQPIAARLGASGMGVVTRVMGLILAAIAMGMLADGLKVMLPGLSA